MKLSEHPKPTMGMRVKSSLTGNEGKITSISPGGKCHTHGQYHSQTIKIRWARQLTDSIQAQCDLMNVDVMEG